MEYKEKILELAKSKPITPAEVASELKINLILAAAILSELASKKEIKISNLKVGSSPLYFLPGNEKQLLNFVEYLNEKELQALEFLKASRIVLEKDLDPLKRVCLRQIKDFALPIEIEIDGRKEKGFKYFEVDDDEFKNWLKTFDSQLKEFEFKDSIKEKKEKKSKLRKEKERFKNFLSWFEQNNIDILTKKETNNKMEATVEVSSQIGKIKFYALAKENLNEADIAKFVLEARDKGLPALILAKKVSKAALSFAEKNNVKIVLI